MKKKINRQWVSILLFGLTLISVGEEKWTASDAAIDHEFGASVSLDENLALIGAPGSSTSGAAYVISQKNSEVAKLTASDAGGKDRFGCSVSLTDGVGLVGAHRATGGTIFSGAAYLFGQNEGGADAWGQTHKLTASDAQMGDYFGGSVSIDGDVAVIGSTGESTGGMIAGAAYVFQQNNGGANRWGEVKKLMASDAQPLDQFGISVSVDGSLIVIGSGGSSAGSAYLFERNEGGTDAWGEVKKLTASDATAGDLFGTSISMDGDVLVVGAQGASSNAGAVYLFERNEGGTDAWGQVKKLTASDATAGDLFGTSVAVLNNLIVVGAPSETSGAGAIYHFERNEGGANTWGEVKKQIASDAQANDAFGQSVALADNLLLTGSPNEDAEGLNAGATYLFLSDTNPPLASATSLTGQPTGTTTHNFATVTVVNSDIDTVQYSLNGGTWIASTKTIVLTGLSDGATTLDVIGADLAGNWMAESNAVSTRWTVDTSIPRETVGTKRQTFFTLWVTNFPAAADMEIALYVDVNSDGLVNTDEFAIAAYDVSDGVINPWGAETFVDDNDALTNGEIEVSIPFYGPSFDLFHTIGDYVFNIGIDAGAAGSARTTVAFAITQEPSSVWISGVVCEAVAPSNRIAGARVQMEYTSPLIGAPPSTWTDETGAFSFYVPDDILPSEVAGVFASAKGRLSADRMKGDGAPLSTFFSTNSLHSGENALPQPLLVVPVSASPDLAEISGTVYHTQPLGGGVTNVPLFGVFVHIDDHHHHHGEIDMKTFSWDVTDRDGHFSMTFPTNYNGKARVSCASPALNQRGIVGTFVDLDPEYPTTHLELFCNSADSFVRSQVADQDSNEPIVGANVVFESRDAPWISETFSMYDGTYEIGLLGGMYDASCERDSLEYRHYISTSHYSDLYLPTGMIYGGTVPFNVLRGYIVSGHITDTNGAAIPHGRVALVEPEDRWIKRINDAPVEPDGTYNLLAPPGEWYLRTEIFDDYTVDLYYTNHYTGNIDSADPITVTTSGLSGIDFALPSGGRVEGEIYDKYSSLAHGVQVRVLRKTAATHWECIGANLMDHNDGRYGIVVPAGSNTYVKTDIEPGYQYPATWYGNTASRDLANAFSITNKQTLSNLNIQLFPGYETHGEIRNQTNMTGITGATVTAYDNAMNHYGTMKAYTNGNFTDFYVPTNTPLIFFATADGFEGEYFDNTYTAANARRIQTNAYEYIHIPFVLHPSAADTDGDGIPDHEEDTEPDGHFIPNQDYTDLHNPDTDHDGYHDGDERNAGTSPQDPTSLFAIQPPIRTASGLGLHWSTVSGRTYSIYGTTNLLQGFQPLETNLLWTTTSHTDTLHHADGQYFYQIRVEKE